MLFIVFLSIGVIMFTGLGALYHFINKDEIRFDATTFQV